TAEGAEGTEELPLFDPYPSLLYAQFLKQSRNFLDQCHRSTHETEGCRIVHEWLQLGTADPAPPAGPRVVAASGYGLPELDTALAGEPDEFLPVRKLVGGPRAVEQANLPMGHRQRMAQHRAKRSDASPAGDEHESVFLWNWREGKRPARAFDVETRADVERQTGGRVALLVHTHQQLDPAVATRVLRGCGNRVRLSLRLVRGPDEHGLARGVIERVAVEIQPDN